MVQVIKPIKSILLKDLDQNPIEFRIKDLLTMHGNVLISAYRKAGKSSLIINLMAALTSDAKFLGQFACKPVDGRVQYVNLELYQSMLWHYCQNMGLRIDNEDVLIQDYLGRATEFMLADDQWREWYVEQLVQDEVKALIIDPIHPLVALQGTQSNDNDESRTVMELLGNIARMAELDHLFVVDHTGHAEKQRARGASAKEDWADILWNVQRGAEDSGNDRYLDVTGRGVIGHASYEMDRNGRLTGSQAIATPEGKVPLSGKIRAELERAGRALTAKELATALDYDRSTVTDKLNEMESLGNVEKGKRLRDGGQLWRLPSGGF
jgi:hypothetical protein